MTNILIVPVGLELDRILESISFVPVSKSILLSDVIKELPSKNRDKSPNLTRWLKDFYKKIVDLWEPSYKTNLIKCGVNLTDSSEVIKILCKIIKNEITTTPDCKIFINISTGTKLFAIIACEIAAFYAKNIVPFYLIASDYTYPAVLDSMGLEEFQTHGIAKGPFTLVKVPVLPRVDIPSIASKILKELATLQRQNSVANMRDITQKIGLDYKTQK